MRPVPVTQASLHRPQQRLQPGLVDRLKDPQVWVCAIAAFTLLGLSTGLLGSEPAAAVPANMVVASASSTMQTLPSVKP